MISLLKEDCRANRRYGFLVCFMLSLYRLGRFFLLQRQSGKFFYWPLYIPIVFIYRLLSFGFGCSIPFSCEIGRSPSFPHGMHGVFISGLAKVGDYCTIMHQVTIGSNIGSASSKTYAAPKIQNKVFIGVGAKIIGAVQVHSDVVIGANSLIIKDVPQGGRALAPTAVVVRSENDK